MSDSDLLNFALNLEYLEAEYYSRAVTGAGLGGANVFGGRAIRFTTPVVAEFAQSILQDELAHVRFLRSALGGAAIGEPAIDFRSGFAAVGHAAGMPRFDPFADEEGFLLGAFVFEDVGVTAYHGAAPLLESKEILTAAAGIHATEAYHAGTIRAVLYRRGQRAARAADAISAVRGELGGGADQPIMLSNGAPNIVPANANAMTFARTPQAVLRILYATPSAGVRAGGFFPAGVNGAIVTT